MLKEQRPDDNSLTDTAFSADNAAPAVGREEQEAAPLPCRLVMLTFLENLLLLHPNPDPNPNLDETPPSSCPLDVGRIVRGLLNKNAEEDPGLGGAMVGSELFGEKLRRSA